MVWWSGCRVVCIVMGYSTGNLGWKEVEILACIGGELNKGRGSRGLLFIYRLFVLLVMFGFGCDAIC